MKPEVSSGKLNRGEAELDEAVGRVKVEGEKEEVEIPKEEGAELSDDEKGVLSILKDKAPIDLNELKGKSGLSNKKWDKAIKGLTKNKLAKVEKTDAGLFVSLA